MASTGIFVVCCSIGSLLSARPRISLTVLCGHVLSDDNNHHQINYRVGDENGAQADAGYRTGHERTHGCTEHTDARQQTETAAAAFFWNNPMRGTQCQRQSSAGQK